MVLGYNSRLADFSVGGHLKLWPAQAVCLMLMLTAGAQNQDLNSPVLPQVAGQSQLTIAPTTLNFDSQVVGTTGQPKTATVSNPGSAEVSIERIIASGIDFDQTNDCGTTLAAGAQCTIQVTFKPATTGPRLGNLTIVVSAAPKPYMIALNGTGE